MTMYVVVNHTWLFQKQKLHNVHYHVRGCEPHMAVPETEIA